MASSENMDSGLGSLQSESAKDIIRTIVSLSTEIQNIKERINSTEVRACKAENEAECLAQMMHLQEDKINKINVKVESFEEKIAHLSNLVFQVMKQPEKFESERKIDNKERSIVNNRGELKSMGANDEVVQLPSIAASDQRNKEVQNLGQADDNGSSTRHSLHMHTPDNREHAVALVRNTLNVHTLVQRNDAVHTTTTDLCMQTPEQTNSFLPSHHSNLGICQRLVSQKSGITEGNANLRKAIRGGYVTEVQKLIDCESCDVNSVQLEFEGDGCVTNLMITASKCRDIESEHAQILSMLLSHPAININKQSRAGFSALHYAARNMYSTALRMLIQDKRCDVNLVDLNNRTALFFVIEQLVNINRIDFSLHPPEIKKSLQLLLDHPQISKSLKAVDVDCESPFTLYIKSCGDVSKYYQHDGFQKDCIDMLLKKQESVVEPPHAFALAIEICSFEHCAECLRINRRCLNSAYPDNETALFCALRIDSYRKYRLLRKYGVNMNVTWLELTPLQYAISQSCNAEILADLSSDLSMEDVQRDIEKCSFTGENPLTCSVRLGVKPWIQYFVSKIRPTQIDDTGLNALHLSCQNPDTFRMTPSVYEFSKEAFKQNKMEEMINWYNFSKYCSTVINRGDKRVSDHDVLPSTLDCRRNAESEEVIRSVTKVVEVLSDKLAEDESTSHLKFKSILAGSICEGTRPFIPNEIDIVCELENVYGLHIQKSDMSELGVRIQVAGNSPWANLSKNGILDPTTVFLSFSQSLKKMAKDIVHENIKFGSLHLHKEPIELRDKISCLRLLWRGNIYKDMPIYVDIVPAFPMHRFRDENPKGDHAIPKTSRHYFRQKADFFHVSYSIQERKRINALPSNAKKGLLKAKALRISAICRPVNVGSLTLEEQVSCEDFITSFMLKSCLLCFLNRKITEIDLERSVDEWALLIYEKLYTSVLAGNLYSTEGEDVFRCVHTKRETTNPACNSEEEALNLACCIKKRVILSLCSAIKEWLRVDGKASLT